MCKDPEVQLGSRNSEEMGQLEWSDSRGEKEVKMGDDRTDHAVHCGLWRGLWLEVKWEQWRILYRGGL